MEFKEISPGVRIPILGIGTWRMGGGLSQDDTHDKEEITAIGTAIELGMTHIDTAEDYGDGHAEELVGQTVQRSNREELFITTKVRKTNLRYDDLISACRRSLQRLRTNYVDLYLLHFPNPEIPIEETMQALDFLIKNNLTRFIGVSNFSVEQIEDAQDCSDNRIVANQIEYNLLTRNKGKFTSNMESEVIPYCQKKGIMIIAFSPLAEGKLAKPGIKILDEIATKYGKTQAQISLNWLITKPNIITIPKAVRIERIKEDLGAIGWRLSKEDMYKLDACAQP